MSERVPWNKGLKGVQIAWNKGKSWSEEIKHKQSISHVGKIPWNKNLNPKKIVCSRCGGEWFEGRKARWSAMFCSRKCKGLARRGIKLSDEVKQKMSNTHKMRPIPINLLHNQYDKISRPQIDLFKMVKMIFPNAVLNKVLYVGSENAKVRFLDVYVPKYNLVFEYDGSYWHDEIDDKVRDDELRKHGLTVIHYVDFVPTEQQIRCDLEFIGFKPIVIYKTIGGKIKW